MIRPALTQLQLMSHQACCSLQHNLLFNSSEPRSCIVANGKQHQQAGAQYWPQYIQAQYVISAADPPQQKVLYAPCDMHQSHHVEAFQHARQPCVVTGRALMRLQRAVVAVLVSQS